MSQQCRNLIDIIFKSEKEDIRELMSQLSINLFVYTFVTTCIEKSLISRGVFINKKQFNPTRFTEIAL